jgi:putative DNA primase/helicase
VNTHRDIGSTAQSVKIDQPINISPAQAFFGAILNAKSIAPKKAPAGLVLDMPENIWQAERWLKTRVVMGKELDGDDYATAAGLLDYGLTDETAIRLAVEAGAEEWWAREKVENAESYMQNQPGSRATTWGVASMSIAEPDPEPPPEPVSSEADDEEELLCATDVRPEEYTWLWPGHYACGAFHILAGKPEVGKNLITINNAAVITRGGTWPDGTQAPIGDVIIWSGEEDFEKTTLPRFLAAGGDPTRLHLVNSVKGADGKKRPFDPARDVGRLCAAMRKLPTLHYLIIDPVSVVVAGGRGASNNNAEARRALQPLVELAKERDVVVEGITHFTKDSARRDVLERIIESTAFSAVARIVHVAAKFEDESRGRRWVRVKGNIVKSGGPVGYEYEPVEAEVAGYPTMRAPKLTWGEPLRGNPRALIAEDVEPGSRDKAKAFLVDILRQAGHSMFVAAIRQAAAANGHGWRTIERAKAELGSRVVAKQNVGDQHAGWQWVLTDPKSLYTPRNNTPPNW